MFQEDEEKNKEIERDKSGSGNRVCIKIEQKIKLIYASHSDFYEVKVGTQTTKQHQKATRRNFN